MFGLGVFGLGGGGVQGGCERRLVFFLCVKNQNKIYWGGSGRGSGLGGQGGCE